MFKINTLEFVKNKFLTHAVNFRIGSAISNVPVSAFSEEPDPDPGLFYKVCSCLLSFLLQSFTMALSLLFKPVTSV